MLLSSCTAIRPWGYPFNSPGKDRVAVQEHCPAWRIVWPSGGPCAVLSYLSPWMPCLARGAGQCGSERQAVSRHGSQAGGRKQRLRGMAQGTVHSK